MLALFHLPQLIDWGQTSLSSAPLLQWLPPHYSAPLLKAKGQCHPESPRGPPEVKHAYIYNTWQPTVSFHPSIYVLFRSIIHSPSHQLILFIVSSTDLLILPSTHPSVDQSISPIFLQSISPSICCFMSNHHLFIHPSISPSTHLFICP